MMRHEQLGKTEKLIVQGVTILLILTTAYLLFSQQIISAMLFGAAALLVQKGYLWLRTQRHHS